MSSLFSICRHLKNVKNRVQDMLSCRPSRYYRQHQLIAIICYLLEELRSSVTHSLCLIQNRGNLLQLCSRVGLMTCFKLEFYLLVWKLCGICLNMDHKYKYVCIPVWNYYNYVFLVRNNILLYTLSDPWVTIILNLQVAKQLSTRKCIRLLDM